jgi:glycosyltransferase involved in cell wall biosynthesis
LNTRFPREREFDFKNAVLHFVPGDGPNALVQAISRTDKLQIGILTLYCVDTTLPEYCLENKINYESLGFSKKHLLQQYITLVKFLFSKKPRVVFAHSYYPSLLCAAAAPIFRNIKFISVRHHNQVHILSKNRKAIFLDKLIASLSFHTVAVSKAVKATMVSQKAVASKITVIYNGLPNPGRKYHKADVATDRKTFNLIALGRIDWQKNYEGMLRSVAHAVSSGYDLKLSILGGGNNNYLNTLIELQTELGLENVVEWLGRKADIYPYLQNSDLFVHSAIDEACPLVLIETMMFGIPIFSTNLGGSQDVLDGYYLGSDPRKIESFSTGLMNSLDNLADMREHAFEISEAVIADFSDEKMQIEYTNFAKSIM